MKRSLDDDAADQHRSSKRARPQYTDHFSHLSDELILRILSQLQPEEVCICQRLSTKLRDLASDASIWRRLYFDRFVRPRSSRLPGLKGVGDQNGRLSFPSRASKWLDEQHLVRHGARTDWKQQYKLRHNWSRGACDVGEILVAEESQIPPMIVQMHDGIIFTADQKAGLRAWAAKGGKECLAQAELKSAENTPPTAMAVDSSDSGSLRIIVGFENGSFELFVLDKDHNLTCLHRQEPEADCVIASVAMSWPFVLTMSATQQVSLYQVNDRSKSTIDKIHSVQSRSMWSPLSVSLRQTSNDITISIAFALPTYLSGWTVGIQEIRLDLTGSLHQSRTTSAIDQHFRPLAFTAPPMMSHFRASMPGLSSQSEFQQIHSTPISLSYNHPYLLVSHPDNTLTLYLVFSTTDSLSISAGSRLWGHTSSVSGAHVGGRGKAVSVSRRGDELRIWELEGGFSSEYARKRLASGDLSVRIQPERHIDRSSHVLPEETESNKQESADPRPEGKNSSAPVSRKESKMPDRRRCLQNGIDITNPSSFGVDDDQDELTISRGWIGFDSENVAVLKEQSDGKQALVVYDFT